MKTHKKKPSKAPKEKNMFKMAPSIKYKTDSGQAPSIKYKTDSGQAQHKDTVEKPVQDTFIMNGEYSGHQGSEDEDSSHDEEDDEDDDFERDAVDEPQEDEEAAECEIDDEIVEGQKDNGNPPELLPDIFSVRPNSHRELGDQLRSLQRSKESPACSIQFETPVTIVTSARPTSGVSQSEDDDISILTLQQEFSMVPFFPAAYNTKQRAFVEQRKAFTSVPAQRPPAPTQDGVLGSPAIRLDYEYRPAMLGFNRSGSPSPRLNPTLPRRQFLLLGTPATKFTRDVTLKSPRSDVQLKTPPRSPGLSEVSGSMQGPEESAADTDDQGNCGGSTSGAGGGQGGQGQ